MGTTASKMAAALERKVRAAVAELEKEGVRITNGNVRAKTGGSFRDLAPIVKSIVAEKEARAKAERQVPDMPEDVAELATALWEGAYRLADEAAAAERRAHGEEIKALRAELQDRESDVAVIEDERDAALARAEAAEAKLAALLQENTEQRIKIASLEGRLQGRVDAVKEAPSAPSDRAVGTGSEDGLQISIFDVLTEPAAHHALAG